MGGLKKNIWTDLLLILLSVVLAAAFPWVFLYATNVAEVSFHEILFPWGELILLGLACAAILFVCRVPLKRIGVCSALFLLLFCNYAAVEKVIQLVIPSARYWHVLPCVFVGWGLFCWWYASKAPRSIADIARMIVPVLFGALVVINLVTAIPGMISKAQAENEIMQMEKEDSESVVSDGNQRNIYLMIYDEHASFKQLEEYWDYDNAEFRSFLEDRGFMISDSSQNEYPGTNVVLSNMLNLDYVVNGSSENAEYEYYMKNAYLFDFLTQAGYTVSAAGNTSSFGFDESGSSGASTIEGYSLEDLFIQKTALYPLLLETQSADVEDRIRELDEIEHMAKEPNTSQFTFTYVACPHQPFIFDENGNINPASERQNWDNYLSQLKYVDKHIQKTVGSILEKDPDAVIMICSDHGARGNSTLQFPVEIRCTVLNVIYFGGEYDESLMNLSGVNMLRAVLTKLGLGDFEQLEVPYEY